MNIKPEAHKPRVIVEDFGDPFREDRILISDDGCVGANFNHPEVKKEMWDVIAELSTVEETKTDRKLPERPKTVALKEDFKNNDSE